MSVFETLAQELEKDPSKREALRALLLSEELMALPGTVAALAADLKQLAAEVKDLAATMRGVLIRLDKLESDVEVLKSDVGTLKIDVGTLKIDVGTLKGSDLERRWQRYLPAYLGSRFRRLRVLDPGQVRDLLDDAIDAGLVDSVEADDACRADAVGRGRAADGSEVYVVVEVSVVVDRHDLERAARRAAIISRATGREAHAVGAGNRFTEGAEAIAGQGDILLLAGECTD
ncbi:MAG: hypothetical protein ACRDX8_06830 [Acidimicrobiales bacterium]